MSKECIHFFGPLCICTTEAFRLYYVNTIQFHIPLNTFMPQLLRALKIWMMC